VLLKRQWDSMPSDRQTLGNLIDRLIKEETRMTTKDEEVGAFVVESTKKSHQTSVTREMVLEATRECRELK